MGKWESEETEKNLHKRMNTKGNGIHTKGVGKQGLNTRQRNSKGIKGQCQNCGKIPLEGSEE